MLKMASDNFDKVIVIINATNAIEMDFLDSPDFNVDAVLWVGYTGTWGLNAVADILAGNVNPSGHLVDTFCYDNTTAPSMVGIYGSSYANYVAEGDPKWYQVYNGALDGNFRYISYEEGMWATATTKPVMRTWSWARAMPPATTTLPLWHSPSATA